MSFSATAVFSQNTNTNEQLIRLDSLAEGAFNSGDIDRQIELYYQKLDIFPRVDSLELKAEILFNIGERFRRIGLYNEAAEIYIRQLEVEKQSGKYSFRTFLSLGDLAGIYIRLGELENATKTYKQSISISKKLPQFETYFAAGLNNLGIHFNDNLKHRDSAQYYYEQAAGIISLSNDAVKRGLYGSIRDNIALLRMKDKEYLKASEIFYDNYYNVFPALTEERERYFRAGIQLADTYIKTNDIEKATTLLDSIEMNLSNANHPECAINQLLFLKVKANLLERNKDYKALIENFKHAQSIQDSLNKVTTRKRNVINYTLSDRKKLETQKTLELESLKRESVTKQAAQRLWILGLSSFVLILVAIIFAVRLKQRNERVKNKKELIEQALKNKKLENELLERNIEVQRKDLATLAISTNEQKGWLNVLSNKIDVIASRKTFDKKLLNELVTFVNHRKHVGKLSDTFHEKIEELNSDFFDKLIKNVPNLTEYEIKLCALIRIHLNSKEIATILNINPESVNKSRYRIRKKIGMTSDQKLDVFLMSF
ncbi:hypothetical protein G5B37_10940 [Rasiella rasia]|uniref:HTH luxR-type domain-containing protein n=1 Tax=Rasiella rasia TaxID=2744027 RepID=A0A6G6GNC7_9FLAO|nr:hypothetical protein [Rasiella rasia]QIE60059.1 hypothetical protein G5B37_10940 [Rasiella rasia]